MSRPFLGLRAKMADFLSRADRSDISKSAASVGARAQSSASLASVTAQRGVDSFTSSAVSLLPRSVEPILISFLDLAVRQRQFRRCSGLLLPLLCLLGPLQVCRLGIVLRVPLRQLLALERRIRPFGHLKVGFQCRS